MHFLIRIFTGLFIIWLICNFFYSLGKKNAINSSKKKYDSNRQRKTVESTVVEKEKKTDKVKDDF